MVCSAVKKVQVAWRGDAAASRCIGGGSLSRVRSGSGLGERLHALRPQQPQLSARPSTQRGLHPRREHAWFKLLRRVQRREDGTAIAAAATPMRS